MRIKENREETNTQWKERKLNLHKARLIDSHCELRDSVYLCVIDSFDTACPLQCKTTFKLHRKHTATRPGTILVTLNHAYYQRRRFEPRILLIPTEAISTELFSASGLESLDMSVSDFFLCQRIQNHVVFLKLIAVEAVHLIIVFIERI